MDGITDDFAIGSRRAYQFLRLLEVDPATAPPFLVSITGERPEPLVAIGENLKSIARGMNQRRTDLEQAQLEQRFDELQPLLEAGKESKTALLAWVDQLGRLALDEAVECFPDRQTRIELLETGGKLAYEGGDPKSPFRNLYSKKPPAS